MWSFRLYGIIPSHAPGSRTESVVMLEVQPDLSAVWRWGAPLFHKRSFIHTAYNLQHPRIPAEPFRLGGSFKRIVAASLSSPKRPCARQAVGAQGANDARFELLSGF